MDRPRQNPPGPVFLLFERRVAPLLVVAGVVLGVGLLPVAFVYWSSAHAGAGMVPLSRPTASEAPAVRRAPWRPAPHPPQETVVFRGVNVVPMDAERVLADHDVVVRTGRIRGVGPTGSIAVPRDARIVDARGRYLLPGLMDMHVHLPADPRDEATMLELFVANGVTTVLNLRGAASHLALRERVAGGEVFGPAIFTSGPYISHAPFYSPPPEEAAAAVEDHRRAGYDVIKIHGDFSAEAYRQLSAAARRARIKVVGHAPRNLGVGPVLAEKQHALAHVEEYIYAHYRFGRTDANVPHDADALTRDIASRTRAAGVQVIANLTAYRGIARQAADVAPLLARPEMAFVPASMRRAWEPPRNTYVRRFGGNPAPFERWYGVLEQLVVALDEAGVPLMTGTDTPIPCVIPGFSLHDELQDLVAAGLTPYRALRAATVTPARFLTADAGTIEVGRAADLLLVDGNPLHDIRTVARPRGVMVRGRWLDRTQLDGRLDSVASHATGR
jgi:cytosine/adenosine deaminase-related metal-dependent hydrolase